MPRDLFAEDTQQQGPEPVDLFEKYNINPEQKSSSFTGDASPETTGFKGIAQDALSSASNLLSGLGNMVTQLPGQAYGAGKQILTNPKRAAANAASGVLGLPHDVFNAPANVADYLARKKLINPHDLHVRSAPTTEELASILGAGGHESGDELLRGIAEFAPALRGLKALGAGGKAANAISAAGISAGQNQDPLANALLGPASEAGLKLAGKAVKLPAKLAPTNLYRGTLTPEELQKNLEIARGTNTNLGQILENPKLQRKLENDLTKQPFSGANEVLQNTGRQVQKRGVELLDEMTGEAHPENIGRTLQDALKKAEKDVIKEKQARFAETNKEAEKFGVKVGRKNLGEKAKDILEEIDSTPELKRQVPSNVIGDLKYYSKNADKSHSLKATDIFKGTLGSESHKAFLAGDKHIGNWYKSLKDSLDKDVDIAIESSPSDKLKSLHKEGREFYKNYVVPFEDKDIVKFTKKGGDPDLIVSHFLKNSRSSDRQGLLNKLVQQLPSKEAKLLARSYFSRAIDKNGELNPQKMTTLYNNLGKGQEELLFNDPVMQNKFRDYLNLVKKNDRALNTMRNPPTGQEGSQFLSGGFKDLASVVAGTAAGGVPGALAALVAGKVLPIAANKFMVEKLTSEPFREKFVAKIIKKEKKGEPLTKTEKAMSHFAKAISKAPAAAGRAAAPLNLEINKYAGQEEQK